jgi:hypothetical protein
MVLVDNGVMEPEWWEKASNSINETRVSKWGDEDEDEKRKEKEQGKKRKGKKNPKGEEELSMKRR